MRTKALAAGIIAGICLSIIPSISGASGTLERRSLGLLNDERRARGMRALAWNSRAASVARAHSADMANDGDLRHNPRLTSQMDGWSRLGENVGTGTSIDLVHEAFMNSTSHRENILDRNFTEIGVGVVTDSDGAVWVTQVFFTPMYRQASTTSQSVSPKRKTPTVQRARRATPVRREPARSTPAVERKAKPERKARAPLGGMYTVVMPFGG